MCLAKTVHATAAHGESCLESTVTTETAIYWATSVIFTSPLVQTATFPVSRNACMYVRS
jgi:hypothetical protein